MDIIFRVRQGECYGIYGQLVLRGLDPLRSLVQAESGAWSMYGGFPVADKNRLYDDALLIPEDLLGCVNEMSFPKPVEGGIRLGTLVWYRKGRPVPPVFLVLEDEYALAGDWGMPSPPSAFVVPSSEPEPKSYGLTHKRIRPELEDQGYTGPLLCWLRVPPTGPAGFDGMSSVLGGLPVHGCLELLEEPLVGFLEWIYGGASGPPPAFRSMNAAAIRVTIPPWPFPSTEIPRAKVDLPGTEHWVWPLDVASRGERGLVCSGASGVIADVTARSRSPMDAIGKAMSRARKVLVPHSQARSDALRFVPEAMKQLSKQGFVK